MSPRFLVAGGGTGGHLYPALNLAEELRARDPAVKVTYVGARRGLEAEVLPERDLPYRLIPSLPLHRDRPWRNLRWLLRGPPVLAELRGIFRDVDPDVVVGTGGYAAGPPLLWGRLAGKATALQEQNASPGLVTRLMAPWVDQVHLGFPEAGERIRTRRGTRVYTFGNPVRCRPGASGSEATHEAFRGDARLVLVVGGSQGARGLNERFLDDLRRVEAWPDDLRVVWIAGRDHAPEIREAVSGLTFGERVRVLPYVRDLAQQLHRVELAVCRAGAMFLSELAVAGVPAVLVPFPGASGGHQRENALSFVRAEAAVLREEDSLAPGELWRLVAMLTSDRERRARMAEAARRRGTPDALDRVVETLLELAPPGEPGEPGGRRAPGTGDDDGRG